MSRLDNKVAIVTGAASGMGASTAKIFADEGAKVIGTDVQQDKLEEIINSINSKHGDVAIGIKQDVSSEDDWEDVVKQGVEKFGKLDILVNNAGIAGEDYTFEESTLDQWNEGMNIDATSVFLGIKAVKPELDKQNGGSIINISSLAAYVAGEQLATFSYAAAKGALTSLSKAAAVRLGKRNIRINTILPGAILTPLTQKVYGEEALSKMSALSVFNRLGQPEEVANVSVFLASDDSTFMTGSELIVDGGWLFNQDR